MIKDIVKVISKTHKYKVDSEYWGRIGAMYKRYGKDILEQAIKDIPSREMPLSHMLSLVEKRCQYILENGELDDLTKEILDL